MTADRSIAADLRAALRRAGDPERAAGQQAYMKSAMRFRGVRVPEVRRLAHEAAGRAGSADEARRLARLLWDEAAYREERYLAMGLLGAPVAQGDLDNAPLIEHMVRTGAWWDYTDDLAKRVRELHDAHPVTAGELVRRWSEDDDAWVRRLAILSQLGRGSATDRGLLAEVIEPSLADPEFFLRKAIGWALRDLARTDPAWVDGYVASHRLSPLSRREALRRPGAQAKRASGSVATNTVSGAASSPHSA